MSENLMLSMWLSCDRSTLHRISRLLSKKNVKNMATSRKELSNDVKEVIVSLFLSGLKQQVTSRRLEIPRTTISSVIDRFRKRGNVENIPRKGKQ
jgi:DNA-directed RNA polymerase specialized sigma24 family protein